MSIIDPGDNARAILRVVDQQAITVEKIINTHAHFDHVMAVPAVKASTGAPFYLHRADLPVLHELPERVRLWLDMDVDPVPDPDGYLEHGQIIQVGEEELEVRFTPGHAPGHVVFVHHAGNQVFAGDTLFQGSIGRYDLPGADGPTLLRSIREQLLTLPDDYTVYPGHGPATTIGFRAPAQPLCGRARARSNCRERAAWRCLPHAAQRLPGTRCLPAATIAPTPWRAKDLSTVRPSPTCWRRSPIVSIGELPGEWLILAVDLAKVGAEVRWEAADGHLFPHIYGPIEQRAVVRVVPFPRRQDGTYYLREGSL